MLASGRKGSPSTHRIRGGWRWARTGIILSLGALVATMLPGRATALPGYLDPSFGEDGIVITRTSTEDDLANAVAIQADGKMVVAGYTRTPSGYDFLVARYARGGDLDETFSGDGIVRTDFAGANDYAADVAIQPNGKIVVAGSVDMGGSNVDIGVARYTTDGTLDGMFGGDGRVNTDYGLSNNGNGVALQGDGMIVVVGYAWNGANYDFTVTRYETDGDLDTTFDADGKVLASVGPDDDYGTSVAIQPNGKILAAGCSCGGGGGDFGVIRLETNGALDTTFDTDGKVTTDVDGVGDFAQAIALQDNGMIVVGGSNPGETATDFALARYTPAGALDTTFDTDGKATTSFGTGGDWLIDLAAQHDGRIVAAGWTHNGSNEDVAVARFNADGSLDTRFSGDGRATTAVGSGDDRANGAALQDDGRIVVAGSTETADGLDVAVVRYGGLAEGDLDPTFAKTGWLSAPLGPGDDHARGVAVQPDGKVVVAGYSMIGGTNDFVVARFEADGDVDTSFGGTGWVPTNFAGGDDIGWAVALQGDGRIVVAGYAHTGVNYDFAVARYLSDGTPDPSFGASGRVTTAFAGGNDIARAVAVQPDGKIVVAGYTYSGINNDFALARYNPDGSLDTSFDTDGKATAGIMGDDQAWAVALQDDGDILTAGQSHNGSNYDFALMRWLDNGTPDPSFGSSGRVTTAFAGGDDRGRAVLMQDDGRIVVSGYANAGDDNFAIARYSTAGAPDLAFGGTGKVLYGMEAGSLDQASGATVQPDGRIVLAGQGWSTNDFALLRVGATGSLDPTFDGDGRVRTPIGTGADAGYAIARQDDGRLVVAGDTWNGTDYDIAVVRYAGDTTAPGTTIDSGPSGAVTSAGAATPFVFSSDDADATFRCSLDGAAYSSCVPPQSLLGLADGLHELRVRAVDLAGNVDPTPAKRTWTIDSLVPNTTLTSGPSGVVTTADAAFTFDSDEGGVSFECRLDGGGWGSCTSPQPYAGLSQASHTFDVRAVDAAGNTDATPASRTWSIDTTAPTTSLTAGPSDTVGDTDALFHATSDVPATTTPIYHSKWGAAGVAEGLLLNPNGIAVSDAGLVFVADSINNRIQVFDASGTFVRAWGRDVTIGGGTGFEVCTASCKNGVAGNLDGELNTPRGVALDASGNVLVADTNNHRIQVFAPDGTYLSKLGSPGGAPGQFGSPFALTVASSGDVYVADTGNNRVQRFTGAGAYVGQWATASPPYGIDADASGNLYVSCYAASLVQEFTGAGGFVRQWAVAGNPAGVAIDGSGNVNVARYNASTLSRYGPTGTHLVTWATPGGGNGMVGNPFGIAVDASGNVYVTEEGNDRVQRFSPDGVTFECSLDEGVFVVCSMPHAVSGLADGSHNLRIRAMDAAGNSDATPASRTWAVDTAAPDTTIDSGPSGPTRSRDVSFTFNATEPGTFECRLDAGAWSSCANPTSYTGVTEASHTFEVRALDAAGNADPSPASRTWISDVTAPGTSLDSGPSGAVSSTGATFAFSSTGGATAFACSLDGGSFGGCTSPQVYAGLAQGSHTFQVYAIDAAGNQDTSPVMRTWTADTAAPSTSILAGPNGATTSSAATFTFASLDTSATFECRLDFGSWEACGSPRGYVGLAEGGHTFEVRAVDAAGNIDPFPPSRTWGVDTVAPDTAIGAGPSGVVGSPDANFTFTSADAASYECSIDDGAWTSCATPQNYLGLADGIHTFRVRAMDMAGNLDPTPAARTWTIDTEAPDTSIHSAPSGTVGSADAEIAFGADEVATFECQLDGGGYAACSSPESLSGLTEGARTFEVRATDAAGNTDATPASRTWTVDVTTPDTAIDSGPSGTTVETDASFGFSSADSGATFRCELDDGGWEDCSSPKGYAGIGVGTHVFRVKAVDGGGNDDPTSASRMWTIVPPDQQPDGKIKVSSAADFMGDGIYNASGAGQTASKKVKLGAGATFTIRMQNDGNVGDTLTVLGCASVAGLKVTYSDGTGNVTAAVIAGTYATANLAPGGEADLTASLKTTKKAKPGKTLSCPITTTSAADGTASDTVKAAVNVK